DSASHSYDHAAVGAGPRAGPRRMILIPQLFGVTTRRSNFEAGLARVVNVIWVIGLITGIVCLLLLLYALHINLSDAVTTLSIILAVLFPVYIEHVQRPKLRIYSATLEKTSYGTEYFWAVKILVDHPPLANNWQSLFAHSWLEKRTAANCRA